MASPSTLVSSRHFDARFVLRSPNFLYMSRTIHHDTQFFQTDVTAQRWLLFVARSDLKDKIFIRNEGEYLSGGKHLALLLPPFSVVMWKIEPGHHKFEVYHSSTFLPQELSEQPSLFRMNFPITAHSASDLLEHLKNCQMILKLKTERTKSDLAVRTKEYIDRSFKNQCQLGDFSRKLGVKLSIVSRAFKECYGISPIDYRNRLRVDDSAHMIQVKSASVTEAGLASGFESLNRFYRSFARIHEVRPSQFKLRKVYKNDATTISETSNEPQF